MKSSVSTEKFFASTKIGSYELGMHGEFSNHSEALCQCYERYTASVLKMYIYGVSARSYSLNYATGLNAKSLGCVCATAHGMGQVVARVKDV
jgi:hypothetical protein